MLNEQGDGVAVLENDSLGSSKASETPENQTTNQDNKEELDEIDGFADFYQGLNFDDLAPEETQTISTNETTEPSTNDNTEDLGAFNDAFGEGELDPRNSPAILPENTLVETSNSPIDTVEQQVGQAAVLTEPLDQATQVDTAGGQPPTNIETNPAVAASADGIPPTSIDNGTVISAQSENQPPIEPPAPNPIISVNLGRDNYLNLENDLTKELPFEEEKARNQELMREFNEKKGEFGIKIIEMYAVLGPTKIPDLWLRKAVKLVIEHNADINNPQLELKLPETVGPAFRKQIYDFYDQEAINYSNNVPDSEQQQMAVQEQLTEANIDSEMTVNPDTGEKELQITIGKQVVSVTVAIAFMIFAFFNPNSASDVLYALRELSYKFNPEKEKNDRLSRMMDFKSAMELPKREFIDNLEKIPNPDIVKIFINWKTQDKGKYKDDYQDLFEKGIYKDRVFWDDELRKNAIYNNNNTKSLVSKDNTFTTKMFLDLDIKEKFEPSKDLRTRKQK